MAHDPVSTAAGVALQPGLPGRCPQCQTEMPGSTCPACGLWWVFGGVEPLATDDLPAASQRLEIHLRSRVPLVFVAFVLPLGLLGLAAAIGALQAVVASPDRALYWLAALVGVPLGATVAFICLGRLLKDRLYALLPSRLEGSIVGLRVRVWKTWSGPWDGFQRIDVLVPREQIAGVCFSKDQGGGTMLHLIHRSGHTIGTGWSGSREDAERHGRAILGWLGVVGP